MEPIINKGAVQFVDRYYQRFHQLQADMLDYWIDHTLFHWDFWISVILTIFPWIVWFWVCDKQNFGRILFAGCLVIIIASYMDFLGTALGLWYYAGKALPTIPAYVPWDISLIPIFVMLLLQFKPHLNPWLKGVFFGVVSGVVAEVIFKLLGFYVSKGWHMWYSVPIYVLIYLIAHWMAEKCRFGPIGKKKRDE
ncbi:CBO0543 family protein [Tuberibacillus sp. Marseille-P3662]|uniref:CBO0543 family protein n=1 Tax=Tuberibacillus sp. Marseille-P3662 TaxID=1965358 RepID=UPI000A1CB654|nr:CBO0543 family protein [Tuberibacillus sp. Marseille-P3662]